MADLVVLPEAPPPTMKLLHELLQSGVESTLREAENQDVLEPPYGRKVANPLPKTDDEDGLDADDPWADVEDEEDEDGEEDGDNDGDDPMDEDEGEGGSKDKDEVTGDSESSEERWETDEDKKRRKALEFHDSQIATLEAAGYSGEAKA